MLELLIVLQIVFLSPIILCSLDSHRFREFLLLLLNLLILELFRFHQTSHPPLPVFHLLIKRFGSLSFFDDAIWALFLRKVSHSSPLLTIAFVNLFLLILYLFEHLLLPFLSILLLSNLIVLPQFVLVSNVGSLVIVVSFLEVNRFLHAWMDFLQFLLSLLNILNISRIILPA